MYISDQKYCIENKEYSFKDIEDRLKTICNLNKAESWVYPDLETKPVSTTAKIIRYIKSPLTLLANQFDVFRVATDPLSSLVNRIYQWNGIDIEKSKQFLADIKRCSRSSFDPKLVSLVDQAINKFNLSFPKHQLVHQIHYPLLDTDKEFNLRLFESKLDDDAKYIGANQVVIDNNLRIPRTLYHLLFIYIALKNGNNDHLFPILETWVHMDRIGPSLNDIDQREYERTICKFHPDLLNLLKDKNLTLDQLKWKDVKNLVDDICKELESLVDKAGNRSNLFYHFYRFCFKLNDHGTHFKEVTLRALELEWGLPMGTEVLYRGATISQDDISRGENHSQSLSFSNSLYSGLVFEGDPKGTCAYVYYDNLNDKQLYALSISSSKLDKFFFYPELFKQYPLLPLVAKGEFSHPRLRVFTDENTTAISGAQGRIEPVKKLASFIPNAKIKDLAEYRKKIVTLYQKNIYLLGSNTFRKWA